MVRIVLGTAACKKARRVAVACETGRVRLILVRVTTDVANTAAAKLTQCVPLSKFGKFLLAIEPRLAQRGHSIGQEDGIRHD